MSDKKDKGLMSEGWSEAFTEKWARRKGEQFIPLDGNSSDLIDEHFGADESGEHDVAPSSSLD